MARFQELHVWQKARNLNKMIYHVSSMFPDREQFGMTSQIRRASTSVCCNIAERSGKSSRKEQCRYVEISYSSLMEVWNLIYLAEDLSYFDSRTRTDLEIHIQEVAKMLSGLKRQNGNLLN